MSNRTTIAVAMSGGFVYSTVAVIRASHGEHSLCLKSMIKYVSIERLTWALLNA